MDTSWLAHCKDGADMPLREVPRNNWLDELDNFSRQHEGWLVSVSQSEADGRISVQARDVRLDGVTQGSPDGSSVTVQVSGPEGHLTREIADVLAVRIDVSPEAVKRGLVIESADGTSTNVIFRSPRRPEEVDGIA
jgi:hypothetical protein